MICDFCEDLSVCNLTVVSNGYFVKYRLCENHVLNVALKESYITKVSKEINRIEKDEEMSKILDIFSFKGEEK